MTTFARHVRERAPACDGWSVRRVDEAGERITVRQAHVEPPMLTRDAGLMATVRIGRAVGHGAASGDDPGSIRQAFDAACRMARAIGDAGLVDSNLPHWQSPSPIDAAGTPPTGLASANRPAEASMKAAALGPRAPLRERIDRTRAACASLRIDARIVDWTATLSTTSTTQEQVTSDGGHVVQQWLFTVPNLTAVATVGEQTQIRTSGGQYNGYSRQGGDEVLDLARFDERGPDVAREAIELALAPNCPSGRFDVLLMPDQMMLQIHESIGHPLELDRILGDERNFAGTSFVTLDMFGQYQYGSELLTVTHDPTRPGEFASYAFDDDGLVATREVLIDRGRLVRPLGGALSVARAREVLARADEARSDEARSDAGWGPVANSRACSWNRAPIDRMGNLNVEPGTSTMNEMIAAIDDGVLMQTNCSWSIDDSRNKFQFGCEYGRRIRRGRLAEVVRNPNYRGVSASFWRSLAMVGNAATVELLGTPFCGKGEPAQVIRVGHASPACVFRGVDVFGATA